MELNQLVRKCHKLSNKTYLSDITPTNIFRLYHPQHGGKDQHAWIWNKITSLSPYLRSYRKLREKVFLITDADVVDSLRIEEFETHADYVMNMRYSVLLENV